MNALLKFILLTSLRRAGRGGRDGFERGPVEFVEGAVGAQPAQCAVAVANGFGVGAPYGFAERTGLKGTPPGTVDGAEGMGLLPDQDVPVGGVKGRQGFVGKLFGVSQKGARKWLESEGLPEMARRN